MHVSKSSRYHHFFPYDSFRSGQEKYINQILHIYILLGREQTKHQEDQLERNLIKELLYSWMNVLRPEILLDGYQIR